MPRVAQTLDNQTGQSGSCPPAKMFSSPKSFTTPGLSSSTPQSSGTFSAARTKSRHELEQSKNKEIEIKPTLRYSAALKVGKRPSFSPGGLLEAAVDQHRGGGEAGRKHGGGAVQPGQVGAWESKKAEMFYGPAKPSHSDWNSQITVTQRKKKENPRAAGKKLEAKINQHSKMTPPPGLTSPWSRPVSADLNQDLNLTNRDDSTHKPTEEEAIDLRSPSPISPIPSLLPQQILPSYLIGFKNYGNTCYLNACLQSLLGLQMFITDMMNLTSEELAIDESGQQGLVQSFRKLCLAYSQGDSVVANEEMKTVKKVMEMLDKQFTGNNMQDASEFLSRFIDELSEDAQRLPKSHAVIKGSGFVADESNKVIKNFQHEKEEVLVCRGCKAETKCRIRDMSMWCDTTSSSNLNRTRSMSLQQLLEQSLATEMRERRCEDCGCEEATTTSQLVKLPKVLIIILKRYRFNNQDLSSSSKVSRQVSIPETVSLSSLVSDTVTLPDTSLPVLQPHLQTQGGLSVPLPSSPAINPIIPLPSPVTPTKFKGVTEEQVASFNEQDQLDYMLFISQKEAHASEKAAAFEDVDEDLKAALEASMRDDTFNLTLTLAGEPDQWADAGQDCRTPSRKRNYRQFNSDGGDGRGDHDWVTSSSGFTEEKMTYSKVVEGSVSSSSAVPRPTTKEQEEEDLRRALELSTQEPGFGDNAMEQMEVDDNENNNNNMLELDLPTPGLPEHTYQLQSVVSHHGSSASFGHYVADVFRFDGGGWHRYDDTRVTRTDSRTVRTGPNCSNGYILTYLYQPLWEGCQVEK